jgi:hypothetical protein
MGLPAGSVSAACICLILTVPCIAVSPTCSLRAGDGSPKGDSTIQKIIDNLPKKCEEAGKECKK